MSVTSLVRVEMAWAMAVALLLGLALLAARPGDRASTRNALILLGICALAELAEAVMGSMAGGRAAAVAADVASVLIGVVLIRLATLFVFRVALPAVRIRPARIAEDLASAALFVAWGLTWLRLSGVDTASLFTTSAIITGVLAFSMQETLGNVLGGVLLQLDRSIRVGDWVRLDDMSGRVVEVRWRHTAIETRGGETIVVPNGWLMKNRFTVIGSRAAPQLPWRRAIHVNVDLAAAPGEVCRVLEDSVRNAAIANVASNPGPSAVLLDIGPRHGSYALRYWLTDPGSDDTTDSAVRAHAIAALRRASMKLGAPYQEEFSMRDDEAHRATEGQVERARRLEALGRVELFTTLAEAERETLARHLVYAPFVAGDVMTRQGAVAHWLYLVIAGEAEVWIETDAARERIATLAAGSVFGEMGMMTGEPRSATVTARTDVICYRLDKGGFAAIIKARPDIAEAMSKVLARRQTELQGARAASTTAQPLAQHADILARIREFFGLDSQREGSRLTPA